MPKIPRGIWLAGRISWLGGEVSRRLGPFCPRMAGAPCASRITRFRLEYPLLYPRAPRSLTYLFLTPQSHNLMIRRYNDSRGDNYFLPSKKIIAQRPPEIIKNVGSQLVLLLGREWGYAGYVQSFITDQYISYSSYTHPVEFPY